MFTARISAYAQRDSSGALNKIVNHFIKFRLDEVETAASKIDPARMKRLRIARYIQSHATVLRKQRLGRNDSERTDADVQHDNKQRPLER